MKPFDDVNNRFFDAKIREFVYRLELTDNQRDAFIPIYKRYSDEMRAAVGERQQVREKAATSEEAAARAKEHIERVCPAEHGNLYGEKPNFRTDEPATSIGTDLPGGFRTGCP